jgi:lipopolysaccharide transport system permease protein
MTSSTARPARLTIIRPDSRLNEGLAGAVRHLARETWSSRGHVRAIFMRDFRAGYRGTRLGVFWNIVLPLVPMSIYMILAQFRVFPGFENVSSAAYIAYGVTLWFLFEGLIAKPIAVVRSRNAEVMKTALPLSTAVVSSFGGLAFEALVRIVFTAAVILYVWSIPHPLAPAALLVILPAALMFTGLGLLLSMLSIVMPDVERVVTIALRYGIFVSGIIFPLSRLGPLEYTTWVNPFYIFIQSARDLFFHGALSQPVAFAIASALGLVLFLIGCRVFYLMEYRIRSLQA